MPQHVAQSLSISTIYQSVFVQTLAFFLIASQYQEAESMERFTNSLGMTMIRISPGQFTMGQESGGDYDESPVHEVTVSKPFFMGATEVTNAQYEQFDPTHKTYRGTFELSNNDDDAVFYVDWYEAVRFCEWLSEKEGKPYRLPTEAEWEYACRAGTTTPYFTGEELPKVFHKSQEQIWQIPQPVSLQVGQTPANAWDLFDMHGNLEEWCSDWYGPYEATAQTDPVGRASGTFKVTRGGSHQTPVIYLRSANRLGTLPEDKHWLIGFRVVMGEASKSEPLPPPPPKLWASDVRHQPYDWTAQAHGDEPFFEGPIRFVHHPEQPETIPMYSHNHCPSITWCDNGDLLAVWYSTISESGREMTILASRLRQGNQEWDRPSEFYKAPDRNMTGSSLFNDGKGTLYFFNGLEADGTWGKLAMTLRTSTDHGITWSHPRLISPEHRYHNQVISGTSMTREGYFLQPCDAVHGGDGGTALHISHDGGKTWIDHGKGQPQPEFTDGGSGTWIAGIHAGVVGLTDGRLLAFGRGDSIKGKMPQSISTDLGKSWTYSASLFSPISGGQRLVLMRLQEGPLLFVSFTDPSNKLKEPTGLELTDAASKKQTVYGLYAAVSFDEGKTWPYKRSIAGEEAQTIYDGGAWTGEFQMDRNHAEPKGYMAATQSPDGVIHLISSALHYRFNLAWLKTPMPAEK